MFYFCFVAGGHPAVSASEPETSSLFERKPVQEDAQLGRQMRKTETETETERQRKYEDKYKEE